MTLQYKLLTWSLTMFRDCVGCKRKRLPEGGCDLGYGRFKCSECWRNEAAIRSRQGLVKLKNSFAAAGQIK